MVLTIAEAGLNVGQISLKGKGSLRGDKKNMALITDLDINLATPSLGTISNALPERIVEKGHQFSAGGSVGLNASIKGLYTKAKRENPSIYLDFLVDNGNFKFDEMKYGIDKLNIAAEMMIDGKNIKKSFLNVKELVLSSDAGVGLKTKMKATNILGDFDLDFILNCAANNNKIVCELSLPSDNIDLTELYNTSITASNLNPTDTDKIEEAPEAISTEKVDSLKIIMIPKSIDAKLNVNLGKLTLGKHIVKNVNGMVDVSERTIKLNNLELFTANSQMNLSALYNSVSDTLAHSTLSLNIKKIVLKDMIV